MGWGEMERSSYTGELLAEKRWPSDGQVGSGGLVAKQARSGGEALIFTY
jgi:hypothetical protein